MKRLALLGVLVACGANARAPAGPAQAMPTADGVHVTLPHWFQADFPGRVEESQSEMHTDAGNLPFRQFTSKAQSLFVDVRVAEAPAGFGTSKENFLASIANAASTNFHEGAFVGADAKVLSPPHTESNPSGFEIACRMRELVSDTKLIMGVFCGGPHDAAVDRAADSLHVIP